MGEMGSVTEGGLDFGTIVGRVGPGGAVGP